jgi:hypothetical protein
MFVFTCDQVGGGDDEVEEGRGVVMRKRRGVATWKKIGHRGKGGVRERHGT